MLTRSKRLTKKQVDAILEKGKTAHSRSFLLRYTSGNSDTRIGAIVPKKVGKTAVERSTTRRVIYNSVKPTAAKMISGLHLAIFAKKTFKNSDAGALVDEFQDLFVKTGLLV